MSSSDACANVDETEAIVVSEEVFKELPMEFAVEAQKLMEVTLEGSIG